MSINRGMDKEDVVHVCNGMFPSRRKNESTPSAETSMGPEVITLSQVSQKEKDKHHMYHLHVET